MNPGGPQRTWRCRRYRFSSCTVKGGTLSCLLPADGMPWVSTNWVMVLLLMVQKSGKLTSWGTGSWSTIIYREKIHPSQLVAGFCGPINSMALKNHQLDLSQILHHWLNFEKGVFQVVILQIHRMESRKPWNWGNCQLVLSEPWIQYNKRIGETNESKKM